MVDRPLVEQAKGLAVADRWEFVVELWNSLEKEEFPTAPDTEALLVQRSVEAAASPPRSYLA